MILLCTIALQRQFNLLKHVQAPKIVAGQTPAKEYREAQKKEKRNCLHRILSSPFCFRKFLLLLARRTSIWLRKAVPIWSRTSKMWENMESRPVSAIAMRQNGTIVATDGSWMCWMFSDSKISCCTLLSKKVISDTWQAVVAINRFGTDTDAEIALVKKAARF